MCSLFCAFSLFFTIFHIIHQDRCSLILCEFPLALASLIYVFAWIARYELRCRKLWWISKYGNSSLHSAHSFHDRWKSVWNEDTITCISKPIRPSDVFWCAYDWIKKHCVKWREYARQDAVSLQICLIIFLISCSKSCWWGHKNALFRPRQQPLWKRRRQEMRMIGRNREEYSSRRAGRNVEVIPSTSNSLQDNIRCNFCTC